MLRSNLTVRYSPALLKLKRSTISHAQHPVTTIPLQGSRSAESPLFSLYITPPPPPPLHLLLSSTSSTFPTIISALTQYRRLYRFPARSSAVLQLFTHLNLYPGSQYCTFNPSAACSLLLHPSESVPLTFRAVFCPQAVSLTLSKPPPDLY